MAAFEQRREAKQDPMRLLWRRVGAVLLLLLTVALFRGVWGVYQKEKESNALRIEAQSQLSDLERREGELRMDIAELKTDRGIEEELRERYNLAREGEGVVVLVEPPQAPPEPRPSRLQKVKEWFSFD